MPFFPPASTQFWIVANGTNTRWSRQRCQLADWYGRPSSTTSRTAIELRESRYKLSDNLIPPSALDVFSCLSWPSRITLSPHWRSRRRFSAASLDVCDPEPIPLDSPLRSLPNVITASHIASASPKAVRTLRETAVKIAVMALRGLSLPNIVNGVTR